MDGQRQPPQDTDLATRYRVRLRRELARLYYGAMPIVLAANLLNASLLVAYFAGSIAARPLFVWWLVVAVTVALRAGLWLAYRRKRAPAAIVRRWYALAIASSALSGATWGAAGVLFFSPAHAEHNIVLGFVLGGMAAGALASLTSILHAYQSYLLLSMLPLTVELAFSGGAGGLAMAAMCGLFVFFLLLLGRRAHAFLRQSLLIRFEHAALVEGLERRISERTNALREINQRLSDDIAERQRAEATLADYGDRQAAVAGFGQRALSGAASEVLFDEAAALVTERLRAAGAAVIEDGGAERGLLLRARYGAAATLTSDPANSAGSGSAASLALTTGIALVSDDLANEDRFAVTGDLAAAGAGSLAVVVIPGAQQPFGVLQVFDGAHRRFSADDLSFMGSIAAILAAAIARRRTEQDIQRLALEDALTGLPNRVMFRERLLHEATRVRHSGRLLGVMLLDLDHFKDINDTLGHPVGDRLLSAVAGRLRGCRREGEAPARLGGDEFALILPALRDAEDAAGVARRIIESIADPFVIEGHDIQLGVSIGITLCPTDGDSPDALLRNADLALYQAKADGRNTFRFYASRMSAQVEIRKILERDLRSALQNDGLDVHYQPQFDLRDGRITAAEALVRWQHRTRGPLQPDAFIPVAENSGLVVPLGTWVLERVCRQARAWQQAGCEPIVIAVNLSPSQCRRVDLAASMQAIAARCGYDPRCLEVEVTEQIFLPQESSLCVDGLRRLQRLGITVSIDDFGTGYSSLGRLQGLPVDKVKIDRCFISGIGRSRDAELIVGAMITLSRSLGLKVVAEGVETREQLDFLRSAGCDLAQGYHLAPPMSGANLAEMLRRDAFALQVRPPIPAPAPAPAPAPTEVADVAQPRDAGVRARR